jgi:hypothetical protein
MHAADVADAANAAALANVVVAASLAVRGIITHARPDDPIGASIDTIALVALSCVHASRIARRQRRQSSSIERPRVPVSFNHSPSRIRVRRVRARSTLQRAHHDRFRALARPRELSSRGRCASSEHLSRSRVAVFGTHRRATATMTPCARAASHGAASSST